MNKETDIQTEKPIDRQSESKIERQKHIETQADNMQREMQRNWYTDIETERETSTHRIRETQRQ